MMQLDIQCEVDRRHRGSAADKDVTRLSSLVVFGAELGANESWVRINLQLGTCPHRERRADMFFEVQLMHLQ